MGEPEIEIATEFAKELAKQLPVKEALSPSARQAGQILEDIVKTIQLALAPLQFTGALQDRLRDFIDRSVRRIPEQNRVSPPPQILGPIIEAIRYEPPETELDQMFSELLSASMDQTRLKDAHPAFPSIIRSLSSDEARLLRSIATPVHPESRYVTNLFEAGFNEALLPADLTYPDNCWAVYLPHLNQLGLIDFGITRPEPTLEGGIRMTGWGYHFMRAVTPPASAT